MHEKKGRRAVFIITLVIIVCMALYGLLFRKGETVEWPFSTPETAALWEAAHHVGDYGWDSKEKAMRGKAVGEDPYLILRQTPPLDAGRMEILMLEAKIQSKGGAPSGFAQFYWAGEEDASFRESASASFRTRHDDRYHRYFIDLGKSPEWRGVVRKIRLDPLNREGTFVLKRIRIGQKDVPYYLSSSYNNLSPHDRAALLLILIFLLFVFAKKAIESVWPDQPVTAGLKRLAGILPSGILLVFFFLISLFPFSHYPGWRFKILGADCLFPSLFLILALLLLFLGKEQRTLLRILVVCLFLVFLLELGRASGSGPWDGWRLTGVGVTVGLLAIAVWRQRGEKLGLFHFSFLLFIAVAFASCLLHYGDPPGRYFLLNFYVAPLILFTLASGVLRDRRKQVWFLKGMILAGVFVAVYAIIEYFFGHVLLTGDFFWKYAGAYAGYGGIKRAGSTLIQPLVLTSYFLVLLPLCGFFFRKAPTTAQRLCMGAAFALFAMALILAKSRTGWILSVVVLFIAFAQWRKKHICIVLVSLVVVLLAEFFMFFYGKRHGGQPPTQEIPYESAEGHAIRKGEKVDFRMPEMQPTGDRYFIAQRLSGLKTAIHILRDKPWLGVGPGNFRAYSREHELSAGQEGHRVTPENMYLMLAAETGMAGFFLFMAMIWAGIAGFFRRIRAGGSDAAINKVMLAATAGLLLHMLFYDLLYWYVPACLFWMLAGFGGGLAADEAYGKKSP